MKGGLRVLYPVSCSARPRGLPPRVAGDDSQRRGAIAAMDLLPVFVFLFPETKLQTPESWSSFLNNMLVFLFILDYFQNTV